MFTATDVIAILGRRGTGKSTLAKRIQKLYPRRVIFDVLNEYPPDYGVPVYSFEQFRTQLLALLRSGAKTWTIVYHFDLDVEDGSKEFDEVLRVLYHLGNMLVVVEEVQYFSTPHKLTLWLKNCLLTGRHRNLAMIFTTQRPGECNKTLLSQSNHVFCGALHEVNDVKYVEQVLGPRAKELPQLPDRKFFHFRPGQPISLLRNDLK